MLWGDGISSGGWTARSTQRNAAHSLGDDDGACDCFVQSPQIGLSDARSSALAKQIGRRSSLGSEIGQRAGRQGGECMSEAGVRTVSG
jgi:hypothetical protein